MIKVDGQSYEYLGDNQFRNNQTHAVIDGKNIRPKHSIDFVGNNTNYSGVNIGGRTVTVSFFKTSKSQKIYFKNVYPKIKKEIEHSIPLKDEKAKQKVLRSVTRHASCNYISKTGYGLYRIGQCISGVFGKSDWQTARKALQIEMDSHAAHQLLKDRVNKFKLAKASCKNV